MAAGTSLEAGTGAGTSVGFTSTLNEKNVKNLIQFQCRNNWDENVMYHMIFV